MLRKFATGFLAGALVMAAMPAPRLSARPDQDDHDLKRDRHVLLISIDGMHAVDYENCVVADTCPTLAALGKTGVNYTRTSTSRPSDSFPGLMALVTGGTPKTVGAFYDVAYDRVLAPPPIDTGNGLVGWNLHARNVTNGTQTEYEEGVEFDQSQAQWRRLPMPPSTAACSPSIPISCRAIRSITASRFTPGTSSAPTRSTA